MSSPGKIGLQAFFEGRRRLGPTWYWGSPDAAARGPRGTALHHGHTERVEPGPQGSDREGLRATKVTSDFHDRPRGPQEPRGPSANSISAKAQASLAFPTCTEDRAVILGLRYVVFVGAVDSNTALRRYTSTKIPKIIIKNEADGASGP
jgi:hypothetical protein